MTIRLMCEKDIAAVEALEKRTFSMPWSQSDFERCVQEAHYRFFVAADEEERILGYAGYLYDFDEADITNVAVDEACRRKGIARHLLQTLLSDGQEQGVRTFFLEVRDSNLPAVCLYESFGFQRVGTRKDYYREPREDARVYSLQYE
ncbi:MAG: ribosomal protein S18-alanine N-acetyltransferase [Lachnospiraceae bacterium]|nr:ribosomal protein S18-alanine N-acetyltransferase [Lachnospiraceae bacterium]